MSPNDVFARIHREIQTQTMSPALWTQAFAEANGNETVARARYIRLRQAELQAEAAVANASATGRRLAELLREAGRSSLYDELGVLPDAEPGAIHKAIEQMHRAESQGKVLPATAHYAIQTLGDPGQRRHYDESLLKSLTRPTATRITTLPEYAESESNSNPWRIAAMVASLAVVAYAAVGWQQGRARIAAAELDAKARHQVALVEAEAKIVRIEAEKEAATRAAEQAAAQAERDQLLRQRQADDQLRAREAATLRQQEREQAMADMRSKREAELRKRQEQDQARRLVADAERELCSTARRNNNPGAMAMYCK